MDTTRAWGRTPNRHSASGLCALLAFFWLAGSLAGGSAAWGAPSFENPHGDLSISCDECHTTEGWTPLLASPTFDHAVTGFPLDAGHRKVKCASCHAELEFAKVGSACADCHLDVHLGELGFACGDCHEPTGWDPRARFSVLHDATFPLTGAHRSADCAACHTEDPPFEFQLTPTDCFLCHVEDYQNAEPDHVELGFPTSCEGCHTTDAFTPATFDGVDHDLFFPLRGAHAVLDCTDCHSGGFGGTPSDCFACHADDYNATRDPNHAALGFPTMCEVCHGTTTWEGASEVDHNQFFPLNGVHAVLDCESCHADGFEGTPTDCFECHQADYNATSDPNHAAQGFSTDCEGCHSESNWSVDQIDHEAFFPLRGAHQALDCEDCHAGGFAGTPTDCYECHREDYESTDDPDHIAQGFPTDCEQCHSESSWEGATADHSFFPLTGAHAPLDCEACHAGGFEGTPTDCASCHIEDYNNTTDPDHQEAGFPTMCEDCHGTSTWEGASADHSFWPLTGAHAPLDCEACHAEGFEGTPTDCAACHIDDYNNTDDPDHQAEGFPTTCEDCHNTSDWEDADFSHGFWPLTGQHQPLDCQACHAEGYPGTPTECVGCHLDDYNNTDDPDHQAEGFPTTCEDCHNTSDWEDADFNHGFWPLTGQHQTLDCQDCHAEGYPGTPTECVGCHLDDYNNTDDPDHQAAGFPTTCEDCHNTSDWEDADFNHDQMYFPIYSGRHDGEWEECSDCHVVPNDYGFFECIFCHEHNQADTDDQHDDVNGYQYESQACYNCHPNGEADD